MLHSLGLAFHSWQRDCCWSREVGQKVVVPAVGTLTVTQLQSLVLKTKVPVYHWHLSSCLLHLQVFPQHGTVSLCLLGLLLLSRQPVFGNPSILPLYRTSGPWLSLSRQSMCRSTIYDELSNLGLRLVSFFVSW